MKPNVILLEDVEAFVFDFDGVLTDNKVILDQEGKEFVTCSRSDGLAFQVLNLLNKKTFILSTEKNPVVSARANKLKIKAIQGVNNKLERLLRLSKEENFDIEKTFYVGNDLNDFEVMSACGFTACPSDSHDQIKSLSTYVCKTKGGNGIVREVLEVILEVDFLKFL